MATNLPDEPGQPPALTQEEAPKKAIEQVINPFEVSGGVDESGKALAIDFDKIVRDFGATPMSPEILARFERVTGKRPHRLMRRGMVSSHRDLDKILDRFERNEPFYLYTGRGPSSDSMHVGHAMPFELTRYLQEAFQCPLVIMLTDDEKFMHTEKLTIEDAKRFAVENARDIIAMGFDPASTFIFSDFEFVSGPFYENICMIAKHITVNQIKGTFGFNDSVNIGKFHFPATQSATAYATSFPDAFGHDKLKTRTIPCLIPCAIDQDPYFRQCRDRAEKMKHRKPALIHMTFLPALQGPGSKMSASVSTSAIFLSDKANEIKNKINKYAFSGGQTTLEEQRRLGGRTDVDVPFQYLTFFMEDDDELERIRRAYESGELATGEMKAICIQYLQQFVSEFQARRKTVTDDVRQEFFKRKPLLFRGRTAEEMIDEAEARKKAEKAASKAAKSAEKQVVQKEQDVAQVKTVSPDAVTAASAAAAAAAVSSQTEQSQPSVSATSMPSSHARQASVNATAAANGHARQASTSKPDDGKGHSKKASSSGETKSHKKSASTISIGRSKQ